MNDLIKILFKFLQKNPEVLGGLNPERTDLIEAINILLERHVVKLLIPELKKILKEREILQAEAILKEQEEIRLAKEREIKAQLEKAEKLKANAEFLKSSLEAEYKTKIEKQPFKEPEEIKEAEEPKKIVE